MSGEVLGFVGGTLATFAGIFGVIVNNLSKQVTELRGEVRNLRADLAQEKQNSSRLWRYCRQLLDMYYRWRRDDAPEPDPMPNMED